ncbi:MAG: DUF2142 domain-containing protein [Oscillospiraceae bacterium]
MSRREIINDDIDDQKPVFTTTLNGSNEIRQDIYAEGRLYGVILKTATFDKTVQGLLTISVTDENGTLLTQSQTDAALLHDSSFYRFLFDEKLDAGRGSDYTLSITFQPASAKDELAFWKSAGAARSFIAEGHKSPHYSLSSFTLWENGVKQDSTLALQYVTHYSGNFLYLPYLVFVILLTLFLMGLYWFLFVKKAALHKVFLPACLILGTVFLFLIPFRTAPDEYAHIAQSYHYSNIILGQAELGGENTLTVRKGDEMMLSKYDTLATDIFSYQEIAEDFWDRAPGGEPSVIDVRYVPVSPILHVVPTLGILVARILGLGRTGLLTLGRFANLLLFAVVMSRAIKRMPFAKHLLFCIGLLPMTLQLAASFGYDVYILSIVFYYFAYLLSCIYGDKPTGLKQLIMFIVLALLLLPAKYVYVVLMGLILLLFKDIFKKKNKKAIICICVAFVALAGAAFIILLPTLKTFIGILPTPEQIVTGIMPNGDSQYNYSLFYIINNTLDFIKLITNTIATQIPLWLQGLLGGRLGEIIAIHIEINWVFIIAILIVLLLSAVPDEENSPRVLSTPQRTSFALVPLLIAALIFGVCVMWTPINYATVFGVQGRYFLPLLPFVLMAVRGKNLRFKKDASSGLIFAMAALCILVQFNAFTLIIQR